MSPALRAVLLVHRYLGVAVGIVMTVWCLSGFVMIYSGYPRLTASERLRGLAPLRMNGCCAASAILAAAGGAGPFEVEMLAGQPVLRVERSHGDHRLVDLATGAVIGGVDQFTARSVATTFASGLAISGRIVDVVLIEKDQWTVEGASRRGPVYRIAFDDPARTQVYVARSTGEVTQKTTGRQRFWGWLGAVPHWLYPTVLRQNGELWSQVVIWTSLAGVFLTATGLFVGMTRLRRDRTARRSPYRGLFYWHHLIGLAFGVLALAWVGSGLLTMNPWGLLDTSPGVAEQDRLAGPFDVSEFDRFISAAPGAKLGGAVTLQSAPLAGHLFVVARGGDGRSLRLDADGQPAPLDRTELDAALRSQLAARVGRLDLITQPDDYDYDGYDTPADLPAYRVSVRDGARTTLYLDPLTGTVMRAVDDTQRLSRWTRTAWHDWDFKGLRRSPLWGVLVLSLLSGVTALSALGAWLGIRRVRRDWTDFRLRGRGAARRNG